MVCKETLGIKIKILRKAKKITQEKFSEMIDVSPRHMINIEMGYVYPTIDILQKISSVLEVPIKYFFDEEDFDKYYLKSDILKTKLHEKIDKISEQNLRILSVITDNMN